MRAIHRILLIGLCAVIALTLASGAASATTSITVTTTADGSGTGDCTTTDLSCGLRQAVAAANAAGGATIIIPPGTYTLTMGPLNVSTASTLQGASAASTVIDGDHSSQVLVSGSGSMTLNDLTIQNGDSTGSGGGIQIGAGVSATLTGDIIRDNTAAADGGGIATAGSLTLDDDVIEDNAIVDTTNSNSYGGGLYVSGQSGPSNSVTVQNTTISGNQAAHGGGIDEFGGGGTTQNTALLVTSTAIIANQASALGGGYAGNQSPSPGTTTLTMIDTTVADNSSAGAGGGLGIGQSQASSEQFLNDTIAANSAPEGGDIDTGANPSTFENTIVAGGTATDGAGAGPDCDGTITALQSLGHNLEDRNGCDFNAAGDLVNTDPQLGPLADNGGPTESMAPSLGSPAINAGASAPLVCPAADQRGVVRPQGSACDIGAYESALPLISAVSVTGASATAATVSATVADPDLAGATVGVEWGTAAGLYTSATPPGQTQTAGPQSAGASFALSLAGLQPGTTYHYAVTATTPRGTVTSADQTLTTAPAPTTTMATTSTTTSTTTPTTTTTATTTSPTATTAPPSNLFTVTKLKVTAPGRLTATLGAPDAGTFTVRATFAVTTKVTVKQHGKTVVKQKITTFTYAGATVKATQRSSRALTLSLSKAAAAELKKIHQAKLTVAIGFTPAGGKLLTRKLTLTVKRSSKGVYS